VNDDGGRPCRVAPASTSCDRTAVVSGRSLAPCAVVEVGVSSVVAEDGAEVVVDDEVVDDEVVDDEVVDDEVVDDEVVDDEVVDDEVC
jgi:hypothetical protein